MAFVTPNTAFDTMSLPFITLRIVVMVLFRPEFVHNWFTETHFANIAAKGLQQINDFLE